MEKTKVKKSLASLGELSKSGFHLPKEKLNYESFYMGGFYLPKEGLNYVRFHMGGFHPRCEEYEEDLIFIIESTEVEGIFTVGVSYNGASVYIDEVSACDLSNLDRIFELFDVYSYTDEAVAARLNFADFEDRNILYSPTEQSIYKAETVFTILYELNNSETPTRCDIENLLGHFYFDLDTNYKLRLSFEIRDVSGKYHHEGKFTFPNLDMTFDTREPIFLNRKYLLGVCEEIMDGYVNSQDWGDKVEL